MKLFYKSLNIALVAGFLTLAVSSSQVAKADDPQPTTIDDGSDDTDYACSPIFKTQS